MEVLILIVAISFLAGVISCHLFWKWYQSSAIKEKITQLKNSKISRKFDLEGGVTFYRPYRLGLSQEGSKEKLHGISEIDIIQHHGYVELFGTWNKNGENQIDPYSFCLPTSTDVITPDRLIEFGQYFVELGNKGNKELENSSQ